MLFFKWGLDDDTFIQNDVAPDEYFSEVCAEDDFLLQNGVVVDFDVIGAFDETLFADEVFGFSFEVVFFEVVYFFEEDIVL